MFSSASLHARDQLQDAALQDAALQDAALQGEALTQAVRVVSHRLRCPTCQGISVRDSDAAFSIQIREKVRGLLQAGQTPEQIEAYFVSRYGPWILRTPPLDVWGWLLWGLPVAVFALASLMLARVQWRRIRRSQRDRHIQAARQAGAPAQGQTSTQHDTQDDAQQDTQREQQWQQRLAARVRQFEGLP